MRPGVGAHGRPEDRNSGRRQARPQFRARRLGQDGQGRARAGPHARRRRYGRREPGLLHALGRRRRRRRQHLYPRHGEPPRPEIRAGRQVPGHPRPARPGPRRVLFPGLARRRRQGFPLRLRPQQPAHPGPDGRRQGPQDDQGPGPGRRQYVPGPAGRARDRRASDALYDERGREEARRPAQAGQGPGLRGEARARVRRSGRFQERARQHCRERGHPDRGRRRPDLCRLPGPEPDREIRRRRPPPVAGRPGAPLLHGDQGQGRDQAGRRQRLHPGAPAEPLRGRRRRRRAGPDLGGHPDPPDQKRGAGRAGGHRDDVHGRRADDRIQAPGRGIGAADDRRLQTRGLRRRRGPAGIAAARFLRRRHHHPRRPALPAGQVPRHANKGIPHQGIGSRLRQGGRETKFIPVSLRMAD
ncbi:MAG: hypothetical protein MZV64_50205 [Ignavibacteriales bacterium]|nr:hypothetical protein [Ignavibacteriales bacterium]